MILWDIMRSAAHHQAPLGVNVVFEGSCPVKWAEHMKIVKGFYGY